MNPVLHPKTATEYNRLVEHPPQAMVLMAPSGSGKAFVLQSLADDLTGHKRAGYQYTLLPLDDKKSIGIEQIRDLKSALKLKHNERRVVLIAEAHLLTEEAQNSMLKLLEEPPAHVHFLLAVRSKNDVLPTILSRCQLWQLMPVPSTLLYEHFMSYEKHAVERAIQISDGRIGLLYSILENQTDHPLLSAIDRAKDILSSSHFNRLTQIDALTKDKSKDQLPVFMDAMELMCKAAMESAAQQNNLQVVRSWQRRTASVLEARTALEESAQAKLVLTHLFLSL